MISSSIATPVFEDDDFSPAEEGWPVAVGAAWIKILVNILLIYLVKKWIDWKFGVINIYEFIHKFMYLFIGELEMVQLKSPPIIFLRDTQTYDDSSMLHLFLRYQTRFLVINLKIIPRTRIDVKKPNKTTN